MLNIPNLLTYFRMVLIPCFLAAFLLDWRLVALLCFFVAGATDLIDGYLARTLNQRSELGALLDPIADKLLMATAYVCLAIATVVPWWFVVLMLGKDLFVVGGILYFRWKKVPFHYEAIFWSKVTTLMLVCIGTAGLIDHVWPGVALNVYPLADFVFGGIYVTAVLLVVTILEYFRRGVDILQKVGA